MDRFTGFSAKAVALIAGLLLLNRVPPLIAERPAWRGIYWLVWEMNNGRLNADDYHALAAGYYDGIEQVDHIAKGAENNDFAVRRDFLRFEYHANVHHSYPAGIRFTNSYAMANPEYPPDKPPHVRRIALLGDSVALGPYGHGYDTLLEDRLTRDFTNAETQKYQVLNFAAPGYVLLQMMDACFEKAPRFHPDAYIIQLTSQEIQGSRKHIGVLVTRGVDLKYDFVKKMVAQADVKSSDHVPQIVLKLAPYFNTLTRTAVEKIRERAASQGAGVVVVLVPAAIDPAVTAADFDQLHAALDGMGVPIVDLRGTFRGVDLNAIQVSPGSDVHPNVRGHRMLFDDLYSHLLADRSALEALTGPVASPR